MISHSTLKIYRVFTIVLNFGGNVDSYKIIFLGKEEISCILFFTTTSLVCLQSYTGLHVVIINTTVKLITKQYLWSILPRKESISQSKSDSCCNSLMMDNCALILSIANTSLKSECIINVILIFEMYYIWMKHKKVFLHGCFLVCSQGISYI